MPDSQQSVYRLNNGDLYAVSLSLLASICCFFATISVYQEGPFWKAVALFLCTIAFFYAGSTIGIVRIEVDEKKRVMRWSYVKVFNGRERKTIPFDDIVNVQIQAMSSGGRAYKRLIVKGKNFELPLSSAYHLGEKSLNQQKDKILNSLTLTPLPEEDDFLNVLKDLKLKGNVITAVKYIREKKGWSITQAKEYLDGL